MPGDTLAVHVHEQECDTRGYSGTWPWLFHLEDFIPAPSTVLHEISDGYVQFSDKICIPVRPMVGTIGTAPAVQAVLSGGMGRYGGNLTRRKPARAARSPRRRGARGPFGPWGLPRHPSDGEMSEVEMRSTLTLSRDVLRRPSPRGCPGRALRRATRW